MNSGERLRRQFSAASCILRRTFCNLNPGSIADALFSVVFTLHSRQGSHPGDREDFYSVYFTPSPQAHLAHGNPPPSLVPPVLIPPPSQEQGTALPGPGASAYMASGKNRSVPCTLGGQFSVLQQVHCSRGVLFAHSATGDLSVSVGPGSALQFGMSRDTAADRKEASNEIVKMLPNRKG
jgi:hypothetical protein